MLIDNEALAKIFNKVYPNGREDVETWGIYPEENLNEDSVNLNKEEIRNLIVEIAQIVKERALKILPEIESMTIEDMKTYILLESSYGTPSFDLGFDDIWLNMYCILPFYISKSEDLTYKHLRKVIQIVRIQFPYEKDKIHLQIYHSNIFFSAKIIPILKRAGVKPPQRV